MLKAANFLHTQPWKLAGIETDESNAPMCWQWWAWSLVSVESRLQEEKLANAFKV